MIKKSSTYKSSGVDIEKANQIVKKIEKISSKNVRDEIINNVGGFASILDLKKLKMVNRPIEKAHGLPNECYVDENYFTIEKKKIFENKWIVIGVGSSVPNIGDIKPFDLLGIPLIILRDRNQKVRVYHNVCSHRGYKIIQKEGKIKNLSLIHI